MFYAVSNLQVAFILCQLLHQVWKNVLKLVSVGLRSPSGLGCSTCHCKVSNTTQWAWLLGQLSVDVQIMSRDV